MTDVQLHWTELAKTALIGKTIADVFYMTAEEAEQLGWDSRGMILEFTDGSQLMAQRDDEGNDAGALFYCTVNEEQLFPVL